MLRSGWVLVKDRVAAFRDRGTVTLLWRATPVIDGASAAVDYRVSGRVRRCSLDGAGAALDVHDSGVTLSRAHDNLRLVWRIALGDDLEARLEVTNVGAHAVQVDRLEVLAVEALAGGSIALCAPARDWVSYQHGWQSGSPTFGRHTVDSIHRDPNTADYASAHVPHSGSGGSGGISSEWFTLIAPPGATGPSALLGFTSGREQLADVALELRSGGFQSLRATCYADGIALHPGETLISEPLLIAFGEDPLALLGKYGDQVAVQMAARQSRPVTGWCPRPYFFGQHNERDILANLAQFTSHGLPLEYVVVDNYQKAVGDWLAVDGARHPSGMRALADSIRQAGCRPGISVAPFGCSVQSRLHADHPDWLLRALDGRPVIAWGHHQGIDVAAMDVTHPEVQQWLDRTFRVMAEEWGFELFKVDFAYAAALLGVRSDRQATRAQAYRRGLGTVRQAIGDRYLLASGALQLPSVGLADAMRVGPDTSLMWKPLWDDLSAPAAENAIRNTAARYFMHGRLWANDPDCLMVRTRDDASNLVLNEMRSQATAIGLSGGVTLAGDNFPSLRPGRVKYLRQVLPPTGRAAVPVDLFRNENPAAQVLAMEREWGRWWVVALLNWEDRTVETEADLGSLDLPAGRYHLFNYWRRRYLGVVSGGLSVKRHQPHETALFLLRPVSERPELLTSTFHVAQGAVEVQRVERTIHGPRAETLRVDLEKQGNQLGQLWFTLPAGWRSLAARVDGRKRPIRAMGATSLIEFTLKNRASVEVDFVHELEAAE